MADWSIQAPVKTAPASFTRSSPGSCSSVNISKNGIFLDMVSSIIFLSQHLPDSKLEAFLHLFPPLDKKIASPGQAQRKQCRSICSISSLMHHGFASRGCPAVNPQIVKPGNTSGFEPLHNTKSLFFPSKNRGAVVMIAAGTGKIQLFFKAFQSPPSACPPAAPGEPCRGFRLCEKSSPRPYRQQFRCQRRRPRRGR